MKILTTTLQTAVMLCLFALGAVFVSSMLPIPGGLSSKIVQSGSMEPKIPTGALVVIKPASSYVVGDVITFTKQGPVPTTHRIVSIEESGGSMVYTTKGDANEEADPGTVPASRVLGKVVFSLPYVGYILHTARQPIGFALLIALPAFLVIVEEVFNLWGALRTRPRKAAPAPLAPGYQRPHTKRMLVMGVGALMVLATVGGGHTLAALSDTETSVGNILAATTWDPIPVAPFVNPFMLVEPQMLVVEEDVGTSTDEVASSTEPVVVEEAASSTEPVSEATEPLEPQGVEEAVVPHEPEEQPGEQATPQEGEQAQD